MIQSGIRLIIMVIILGSIICLHVFLSTRKSKWLGLILPLICVFFSIICVFGAVAFNSNTTTKVTSYAEDGTVIEESIEENSAGTSRGIGEIVVSGMVAFIVGNIPTLFYLVIYFLCRKSVKEKQQISHMKIQDLE